MSEVLVLYQISNELGLGRGHHAPAVPSYNAFRLPRANGVTLASVKSSCRALTLTHPAGSDGYHWRVRVDERPHTSHSGSGGAGYSWWDVQDENARLPVKEATPSELKRMLVPKKESSEGDVTQEVTKAAKGAMKYMGKAMNAVAGPGSGAGHDDEELHAIRTPVICFKLLDLGRVRQQFGGGAAPTKSGGARRAARPAPRRAASSAPSSRSATPSRPQPPRQKAPISAGVPRVQRPPPRAAAAAPTPPTADLMGFHSAPAPAAAGRTLHHANSMPARSSSGSTPTGTKPGETRAEKLKREYAQKQATSSRVWDEVDQRWVEGPVKNGETKAAPASKRNSLVDTGIDTAAAGVKGISLSRDTAIGKSANVQAAVEARVNDMEASQQKAITELRAREAAKAAADAEEDVVRQRLDAKLKAWSEEHGKKKQLRALLANLHTILWEGSGWKQVSLADVLDDSKVKRVYHKASRVVHPDKTGHLDAEKRFVAKRVFDALTQAKVEFDEGKR